MMSNYIDTHIHLDLLDDLSKAISYINENKIYVIAMTNHPKVYEALVNKIDSKFIRVALGMHPELVDKANLTLFKKYINSTKYIGEIGLDFLNRNSNQEKQKYIFNEILNISKKKIFSIHSRKAETEVLSSIEKNFNKDSTYILHWYTGGKKALQKAIELGCYFSVNLNMVKSKKFLDNLALFPIEKILVESDAPFSKGNIYESPLTYCKLAKVFNVPEQIMSRQIFENFSNILIKSDK